MHVALVARHWPCPKSHTWCAFLVMVICCMCQWIQQACHLSFYDSWGISLSPHSTLDLPFCLMRTITCHFMHHYITKVCTCWVAFVTGPHFAVALACFLHNVEFAEFLFAHYILNKPSYPGNKKMKMNGFSKYPQSLLQLLWTVYCKDPQLISELLTSLLKNGPS